MTEEKTEDSPPPNPGTAGYVLAEQPQTPHGEAPRASVRLHLLKGGLQVGRGASQKHQLDARIHTSV